jgi:hypothetical protein
MSDIETILRNAILYVAGNEGLAKFNKAGHSRVMNTIVHPDGSLDLPRLMNLMLEIYPEEQASTITDHVLAKYVEIAEEEQKAAQVSVEGAIVQLEEADTGSSYEDNLAKYLETESSDVRDLINEARRIRIAMGKAAPSKAVSPPAITLPEPPKVSIINPVMSDAPKVSIVKPMKPEPVRRALTREELDAEIGRFADAASAYTSVDIMDFIRYLKDKGYQFQENSVLENVYTLLEERKSRERAVLMADIQTFLDGMPWPAESEVSAYIERKKYEGIICEASEIKRMILVEMIRKH